MGDIDLFMKSACRLFYKRRKDIGKALPVSLSAPGPWIWIGGDRLRDRAEVGPLTSVPIRLYPLLPWQTSSNKDRMRVSNEKKLGRLNCELLQQTVFSHCIVEPERDPACRSRVFHCVQRSLSPRVDKGNAGRTESGPKTWSTFVHVTLRSSDVALALEEELRHCRMHSCLHHCLCLSRPFSMPTF